MPPKKAPVPGKKTEQKKKEKVIEDKTFGLKNKKGSKQQKFIQQVEKQVKSGGLHPLKEGTKKSEKEQKLKEQKELAALFKPVQTQKAGKGADPKSIVCAFFKQGQCGKGDKCKFSHDLTLERKAEKRSLYVDMRDKDEEDTMENWDEEKLKEVIEKKHGKSGKMPTTDIICKHFLEAVEKSKYGWFWQCPVGESCIYRHALPPGFVLKKDRKRDDKKDEITLEELIEKERAALGPKQTRITLETFLAWKKRKIQEKKDAAKKDEDKKRSDFKAGRQVGLSGREMFSFNPEMAAQNDLEDGDEAFDSTLYKNEEDDNIEYREINLDFDASEVDDSGTIATEDRFKQEEPSSSTAPQEAESSTSTAVPINENLFLEEDLEGLDEELENLDVDD
ncbi:zinc finger CCCH domain-containing protein 15 homolog [Sitophilus oryzae]|uniref:Zinc finger CCCH domain-containing protein 15 n=1 Tax=Sitophilus oryzae TaxID=7048 RepID=A0A6J2Y312_SITOR|nr:zinc finger CCCH domain-containing protein 15 homolog [Sitophilus oryzae]